MTASRTRSRSSQTSGHSTHWTTAKDDRLATPQVAAGMTSARKTSAVGSGGSRASVAAAAAEASRARRPSRMYRALIAAIAPHAPQPTSPPEPRARRTSSAIVTA